MTILTRVASAILAPTLAAAAFQGFDTSAAFSVDGHELRLRSAVAIAAPQQSPNAYSWVRIYFYAFPLTADQVSAVVDRPGRCCAAVGRRRRAIRRRAFPRTCVSSAAPALPPSYTSSCSVRASASSAERGRGRAYCRALARPLQ
ncbi:MAG: hypothetical protein ACRD1V_21435, partial [Vicinamibacterales bacterium]